MTTPAKPATTDPEVERLVNVLREAIPELDSCDNCGRPSRSLHLQDDGVTFLCGGCDAINPFAYDPEPLSEQEQEGARLALSLIRRSLREATEAIRCRNRECYLAQVNAITLTARSIERSLS